jgi:hypothetical protein
LEVSKWKEQLSFQQSWDDEMVLMTTNSMYGIISALQKTEIENGAHLSLSASACLDATRQEGGRVISFLRYYIERYVMKVAAADISSRTWFGAPYVLKTGLPAAYTMCRQSPLRGDLTHFLSSAFRTEMASGTPILAMISGENSGISLEEPILGLDKELPLQFLQLAIELCSEKGYLRSETYGLVSCEPFTTKRIVARAHPVAEPGDKVRWVTMEDSFVTLALQPLAHWLAAIVGRYGPLVSAFSRTYKAWDFCVHLQRQGKYEPSSGFGTYDLTGASNQLNRGFALLCGSMVISAFAKDEYSRSCLANLLGLLGADREIRIFDSETEKTMFRTVICSNGLLMGNPGTKELLCLTSACLYVMTVRQYQLEPYPVLIAGDDVIVYADYQVFLNLLAINRKFGNVINQSKTIWSQACTFFTEEVLKLIPSAIGCGKDLWLMPYEEHLHVEVLKLRLLSPYGVQSIAAEVAYANPAIGKSGTITEHLQWCESASCKWLAPRRFIHWMADHLSWDYGRHGYSHADPLIFLPRKLGGWGVPYIGDWDQLKVRIIEEVDPLYFRIISLVQGEVDYHSVFDFLLRRMSIGNTTRGLMDPMLFLLTSQYAALAYLAFAKEAKPYEFFESEFRKKHSWSPRPKDILGFAKKSGFIGFHDVATMLDRLTTIRLGFVVASGNLDISEVLPSLKDGGVPPSPSDVLSTFVGRELGYLSPGKERSYFSTSPEDFKSFREWFDGGRQEIVLRVKQLFVPARAITDSLNGMRIPLPYTPSPDPIKGSEADPDVDPEIRGYIAQVVSLKRLNQ